MDTFNTFLKGKTVAMSRPSEASLTSSVSLHLIEQCQNGVHLLTKIMHQLDTIKQNLLCPDYYDPYLQKEHAEYLRINGIEEPFEITQTFVKAPHWSLVASLTNKTVRQLPSCATKIFTGEERRCIDNSFIERIQIVYEKKDTYQLPTFWESPLQQAAERFRRMLLPKQYQEDDEDDLTNARFFPPLAVEAYHQILGDEKNSWGIVASENLTVHFVQPFAPSVSPPPPKPKRAHA